MEKKEIVESLDRFIAQVDVLKTESGPKANDFVKWVREAKQFIEKSFGADHPQLREFKKIDYYPKQFDILSSESSFKKAWLEGLMVAKGILESLKAETAGMSKEEPKKEENHKEEKRADSAKVKDEETVKTAKIQNLTDSGTSETEDSDASDAIEIKEPVPAPKKKDEKIVEKSELSAKGHKVLLVNVSDTKLNEDLFKFIKKMGYEPVVVDQSTEEDTFSSDVLNSSMYGNPIYAIIHWKGEMECSGKQFPKPYSIFSTGYYVAKLTSKRVLIISYEDINWHDEYYKGLNFIGIDSIPELMELKLAREMDAAGLNIDFNFLKKK